jgi:hypothetical protein
MAPAEAAPLVPPEDIVDEVMVRVQLVQREDSQMLVLVVAQTALRANTRPEGAHLPHATHVLQVNTLDGASTHVAIVRVEGILQLVLAAARYVLEVLGPPPLSDQLHASHVLLERTLDMVMAGVRLAGLEDTPQLVLVVVLAVLLVSTPRPGLVRAPRVPLVSTLQVDGADVITALLEGTQVPALVDARTALTASIRRLLADPRV